jgi:hypothetical protein
VREAIDGKVATTAVNPQHLNYAAHAGAILNTVSLVWGTFRNTIIGEISESLINPVTSFMTHIID